MTTTPQSRDETHTSAVLHQLIKQVPDGSFTLEWFVEHLPNRSFGVILLFLATIATLPIISIPARIIILILTFEIMIGYKVLILPHRWMARPLSSKQLKNLERRVIPWLERLEMVVKPRYCSVITALRRLAALLAFVLTVLSLLAPFPLANIPPALVCIMLALAYIEHDGLLFLIAFILAAVMTAGIVFIILAV